MIDMEAFRDPEFLDDVYRESYSHYRHLEVLRKDHLNTFLVINAVVVTILSATSEFGAYLQENSLIVALGLMVIVFIAFVFYFISRIGEEAKNQHGFVIEKIIEARLGPGNIFEG